MKYLRMGQIDESYKKMVKKDGVLQQDNSLRAYNSIFVGTGIYSFNRSKEVKGKFYTKELVDGRVFHKENGPAIKKHGLTAYYIDGRIHREDGPAIIRKFQGRTLEVWAKDNIVKRDGDKPAIVVYGPKKENNKPYLEIYVNDGKASRAGFDKPFVAIWDYNNGSKLELFNGELVSDRFYRRGIVNYSNAELFNDVKIHELFKIENASFFERTSSDLPNIISYRINESDGKKLNVKLLEKWHKPELNIRINSTENLHRIGKAAFKMYNKNGKLTHKLYCVNGEVHRENGPADIIIESQNKIFKWAIRGKRHRDGKPASIVKKDGKVIEEVWEMNSKRHRKNAPAYFKKNDAGLIIEEEWAVNGKPHRENGPANVKYYYTNDFQKITTFEEWYIDGKRHKKDGPARVDRNNVGEIMEEKWYVDGKLHRDDAPAVMNKRYMGGLYSTNSGLRLEWYQNGELHRDDGPATIQYYKDSDQIETQTWMQYGKKHRLDGPAYIRGNNEEVEYYVNGKTHRVGKPARIIRRHDGYHVDYYYNGIRHRLDGPASYSIVKKRDENGLVRRARVNKEYFVNGVHILKTKNRENQVFTDEERLEFVNQPVLFKSRGEYMLANEYFKKYRKDFYDKFCIYFDDSFVDKEKVDEIKR